MNKVFLILIAVIAITAPDTVKANEQCDKLDILIQDIGLNGFDEKKLPSVDYYNEVCSMYNEFKTAYGACDNAEALDTYRPYKERMEYQCSTKGRKDILATANSVCRTNPGKGKKAQLRKEKCFKKINNQNSVPNANTCNTFNDNLKCVYNKVSEICGQGDAMYSIRLTEISRNLSCKPFEPTSAGKR